MERNFSDRLIVSDLDGTFLGEKESVVVRNMEAIRAFRSKGGRFTFATGRTYRKLCELVPDLKQIVNAPLILLNGTLLYDPSTQRMIKEYRLPIAPILPVLQDLLVRYSNLRIRFLKGNEAYEYHADADDMREVASKEYCNKIVLVGDPDALTEIQQLLQKRYGHMLHTCKSVSILLELLPKGASKGVLLDEMRELLSTKTPLRVYGIGDYENDLELLAHADVAACPQNAIDRVKQISSRILCHHTEGAIADLIQTIYEE